MKVKYYNLLLGLWRALILFCQSAFFLEQFQSVQWADVYDTDGWVNPAADALWLSPPPAWWLLRAVPDSRRPEEALMRKREAYGNSLFIQIEWMSLLDRSLGWETSNGGSRGVGGGGLWLFNTLKTLFLLNSQDMTLLKFSFRCLAWRRSAQCQLLSSFFSPPLPPRTWEFLFQMLDYINFNTGSSSWLNC